MELAIATALAFLAAAGLVYAAGTGYAPVIRQRLRSEYLEVDNTLKRIFYTDWDAKVFVAIKYGGTLIALLLGLLVFNSLVFGLFMAFIVYWVPSVLLQRIIKKRRERLEEQTGDVMTAMSACIKSGMTLEETIEEIATNMRPPIAEEFALIRDRIEAGQTIASALQSADNRLQIPRMSLIFQSVIISQERGGQLASLMDRLSESTREIERVEERVKTETSGLVLSARIMVCMPVLICGFLYLADPEQVTMLFTTITGNVILVIALALDIGAFMIMRKLIDLEV